MFDGARENGVGNASEGARKKVLSVGEGWVGRMFEAIGSFKAAAGIVKGGELDGDLTGLG